MISISNVSSSSGAAHYFSGGKDNYYSSDEGVKNSVWSGKGAEDLELAGNITKNDFVNILDGKISEKQITSDGEVLRKESQLGKLVKDEAGDAKVDHRAGIDVTFSAPKSVSILAEVAGDDRVKAAHERAVGKALEHIESNAIYTRIYQDGAVRAVQTDNMIVARFSHDTSRELDPQTHTHCVIANATKGPDGEWRSISNEEIYRQQKLTAAIYYGELATELKTIGYEVEKTGDHGSFEIKGISSEHIAHFSQRSAQIEAALADKGLDRDSSSSAQKAMLALDTREAKREVDRDLLKAEWQSRAENIGLNLNDIVTGANMRAESGLNRAGNDAPENARNYISFAVEHLTERETVVSHEQIIQFALEKGVGDVRHGDVLAAYQDALKKGELVDMGQGQVTTPAGLRAETEMLVMMGKSNTAAPLMHEDQAKELLHKQYEKQGFNLYAGQEAAAMAGLTSGDRFLAVQGDAGTGKTTMMRAFREVAESQGVTVRGMSSSAVAADVLQTDSGIHSTTVARFVLDAQSRTDRAPGREVWVVDESSFLSQKEMNKVMQLAIEHDAKVVFVGDTKQLAAVGAGKPFDVAQANGMRTEHMTQIDRQKTDEGKLTVSHVLNKDYAEALNVLDKKTVEINDKKTLIDRIVSDVAAKDTIKQDKILIITATNADRKEINESMREMLKTKGVISGKEQSATILVNRGMTDAQLKRADSYRTGDIVVFNRELKKLGVDKNERLTVVSAVPGVRSEGDAIRLKSDNGREVIWNPAKNHNVGVYREENRALQQGDAIRITKNADGLINGMTANVVAVKDQGKVVLALNDGRTVDFDLNKQKHWEHAYAMTIHASQGKTTEATALHISSQAKGAFGDASFYVGVTRSKYELTVYTDDKSKLLGIVSKDQSKTSAIEALGNKAVQQYEEIKSKPTDTTTGNKTGSSSKPTIETAPEATAENNDASRIIKPQINR